MRNVRWKNFHREKAKITPGKIRKNDFTPGKIRKSDFAPQEKFPCYALFGTKQLLDRQGFNLSSVALLINAAYFCRFLMQSYTCVTILLLCLSMQLWIIVNKWLDLDIPNCCALFFFTIINHWWMSYTVCTHIRTVKVIGELRHEIISR